MNNQVEKYHPQGDEYVRVGRKGGGSWWIQDFVFTKKPKQIGIRVQGGYQRDWKGNILVELRL